jgi:hypothetical protein
VPAATIEAKIATLARGGGEAGGEGGGRLGMSRRETLGAAAKRVEKEVADLD